MSEVIEIEESARRIVDLTEEQSAALKSIGKELASKKVFYMSLDDNNEDSANGDSSFESPSVIRCQPVGSGRYEIRFLNVIGAISLQNLTFHVFPKIPLNHFTHLAKYAFEESRIRYSPISIDSLEAFWEVLASWCVSAIEEIHRKGLISDYQSISDDLPIIRGRVDPYRTSSRYMRGIVNASCTFDELSIDNPYNRTLKAALAAISTTKSIQNHELKSRAFRLEQHLSMVGQATHQDLKVKVDRRSQYYANALELSNRFLSGNGVDIRTGIEHGMTFLIPTPGIVESAVRNILSKQLFPMTVRKQKLVIETNPYYSINPDLVFSNGAITGDVKYKIVDKDWVRNDVAQATMFATGFEANAALIVSFSKSPDVNDLEMRMGRTPVHRIAWNASSLITPEVAEEEFISRVRAFLLRYRASESGWRRTA